MNARSQARATLANVRGLMDRLRPLRGPKHIVLMSGGMRFDQELLGEFNHFAHQAATAGVVFHTIFVDQPTTDVTTERRPITSAFGSRDMSAGLTTIAGMTGGSFFHGVGSAAGVFDRIGTEITNFYELGLEALQTDADGKPRDLSVKVARDGLTVRTRAQVALDASVAPKPGTPEALRTLLEQPTDINDLPLQVATYTTRGDDPSLLKVLLTAHVGATTVRAPVQWGFIVLNEENVIASGRSSLEKAETSPAVITASAKLLPGRQRIRFAAIDADGRAGVVDIPLTVGLRAAAGLQLSDLIVGSAASGRFLPSTQVRSGAPLVAMIEVMSSDAPRLSEDAGSPRDRAGWHGGTRTARPDGRAHRDRRHDPSERGPDIHVGPGARSLHRERDCTHRRAACRQSKPWVRSEQRSEVADRAGFMRMGRWSRTWHIGSVIAVSRWLCILPQVLFIIDVWNDARGQWSCS